MSKQEQDDSYKSQQKVSFFNFLAELKKTLLYSGVNTNLNKMIYVNKDEVAIQLYNFL